MMKDVDEAFYIDLLERIDDGVYFVDRDRRVTYWNSGAERISGYDAAHVLGHSCAEGILRHVNERGTQLCLSGCPLKAVMDDGKPRSADVFLHHRDGYRIPVRVHGRPIMGPDGEITGSAEVFARRTYSEYDLSGGAAPQVDCDLVTGLPPRSLGQARIEAILGLVAGGRGSLGLIFLDVDHFKVINDTYGHRVGDQVLRMVGQTFAHALDRGGVPARWGGEEFVALLPGADEESLRRTAERIRMLIENSWLQVGAERVMVTASLGATMARADDSPNDLLDRADRSMYLSKAAGRNRITVEGLVVESGSEAPDASCPWLGHGLEMASTL